MMALDSALVILMAEILAAVLVLAGTWFWVIRNKRNKEISAIDNFVNQMNEQAQFRNQPLNRLLSEVCGLRKEEVQETLQQVSDNERALMKTVIELFLKREMTLLNEVDKCIGDLSEPYCSLLAKLSAMPKTSAPENTQSLERINQQLVRQLDTAMQTIDEITAEYTRVFNGNQTELELENSAKKLLQTFQDSIRSLNQTSEPQ